ncbi:MAG: Gfo/Idh/MocA family oxidoreductase [Gemmatimonadaceae bacterium]
MTSSKLRVGVAGLGRAFMLMEQALLQHPRVELVAAADPRPLARERFTVDFNAPAYASVAELCGDEHVQAVYVATPHELHAEHVATAALQGKHVLVEKPMALTMKDCQAMVEVTGRAGVHLIVGHSHSHDTPYLRTRDLVASGEFGDLRMITALNFTDYLYRPRRPEELSTASGGGVVFGQAPHQVDVVRLIAGGVVRSVRSATGIWDPTRCTEGAYSALLLFENGVAASLTYSGYGHFDSDEFVGGIGELGQPPGARQHGAARRRLRELTGARDESSLKDARMYGATDGGSQADRAHGLHSHFGLVLVSCERADLRPTPAGIVIYGDERQWVDELPAPLAPRSEVLDELCDAVLQGRPPLHTGAWGMATLEVCLGILRSAAEGREITLEHQVPVPKAGSVGSSRAS